MSSSMRSATFVAAIVAFVVGLVGICDGFPTENNDHTSDATQVLVSTVLMGSAVGFALLAFGVDGEP